MPPRFLRFEGFCVDTVRRELRDPAGAPVPLTSKAFDVLCALIAHRHEVASREVLIAEAWPGRVVEENNLTQAIAALRRAFGTDGHAPRFIVTVPGRGYRFVAALDPQDASPEPPVAAIPPVRWRHWPRYAAALGLAALVVAWVWPRQAPADAPPLAADARTPAALVVLPFRSLPAGTSRDGLLELGLADALSVRLGRQDQLRVRAQDSVRRLGALPPDPLAAGRKLGAAYVLEGSIRHGGGRMRVNARLLSVASGKPFWSDAFDATDTQLYALQDRIGAAVVAALALQPAAPRLRPPAPCEGGDVEAHRALLRAQYRLQRRDQTTVQAFQEAVRRDPTCARAYAGLTFSYLTMAHRDIPPDQSFPLAQAAALQALRIDPDSAEAWAARGRQLQLGEWDWKGAEQALRRAIAINPSLPEAHYGLAHVLVTAGRRMDEGLAEARIARELDPLSPVVNALEGGFLSAAARPAQARERLARALALQPDFWVPLQIRGGMALDRGDVAAALVDLEAAVRDSQRASQTVALLAHAEVAAGRRARAQALLQELRQRAARGYVPSTSLAAVHDALGERAAALDLLEQAEREHDYRLVFLAIDARWNALRGEPRFQALADRLAVPNVRASGRY